MINDAGVMVCLLFLRLEKYALCVPWNDTIAVENLSAMYTYACLLECLKLKRWATGRKEADRLSLQYSDSSLLQPEVQSR